VGVEAAKTSPGFSLFLDSQNIHLDRTTQGTGLCYYLAASPAMDSRRAFLFELLETPPVFRGTSFEHEIRASVLNLGPLMQTTRVKERIRHEIHSFIELLEDSIGCYFPCLQFSADSCLVARAVRGAVFAAGRSMRRRSRAGRTLRWGAQRDRKRHQQQLGQSPCRLGGRERQRRYRSF
jgi:hypothetical protein